MHVLPTPTEIFKNTKNNNKLILLIFSNFLYLLFHPLAALFLNPTGFGLVGVHLMKRKLRQRDRFRYLEGVSPLLQKASSVLSSCQLTNYQLKKKSIRTICFIFTGYAVMRCQFPADGPFTVPVCKNRLTTHSGTVRQASLKSDIAKWQLTRSKALLDVCMYVCMRSILRVEKPNNFICTVSLHICVSTCIHGQDAKVKLLPI